MKTLRVLLLAASTAGSAQLAMAELPFSNEAFGRIEATLDFCAKQDPQDASKYEQRKKAIAGDVSEQDISEARGTDEYKGAYEGISASLADVKKDQAVSACKGFVEGK